MGWFALGIFLMCILNIVALYCNALYSDNDYSHKQQKIEHVVLFKFRPNITAGEKQEIINRFLALKNSRKNGAPYIALLEYGYQNSKEKIKGNYDIGFRVSFTSEADRDYYVGKPFLMAPGTYDPMHEDFKNFVGSYLDSDPENPNKGILVFDYKAL